MFYPHICTKPLIYLLLGFTNIGTWPATHAIITMFIASLIGSFVFDVCMGYIQVVVRKFLWSS